MRTSLLLLLFALPLAASAQPTFGVKAGLSVANVYGYDDLGAGVDKSPVLGFTGGLMAQLPISESFAVRPEVLYTMKGTQISTEAGSVESKTTNRINYLEVPVLARVALPVGPFADAGVLVGPTVGFRLSEGVTSEVNGTEVDITDAEDFAETLDVGIAAGAEYGSGPFAVEARYTYGLLNINKFAEGGDTTEDGPSLRNGVFSITGAFRFGQ